MHSAARKTMPSTCGDWSLAHTPTGSRRPCSASKESSSSTKGRDTTCCELWLLGQGLWPQGGALHGGGVSLLRPSSTKVPTLTLSGKRKVSAAPLRVGGPAHSRPTLISCTFKLANEGGA
ncbi:hypothetical protein HYH02_014554 [Chlamydomonas schloesseri]|uniref:Uncharacterized protein n=1 Tax=Chlamydomonas schloesseri TaxID=2026947 RepID=A0A835VVV0_9CHLO|nr:hypothetical protein HYH02_014554 [Chlamydomonas schloesseri]|eukprot:KAG2427723.1 hypothetical protein HYH02_014554 [Chlamydomonas schloesseri]